MRIQQRAPEGSSGTRLLQQLHRLCSTGQVGVISLASPSNSIANAAAIFWNVELSFTSLPVPGLVNESKVSDGRSVARPLRGEGGWRSGRDTRRPFAPLHG